MVVTRAPAGARAPAGLYRATGTSYPCPGPLKRVLAPLGAFLPSCGAVGVAFDPTLSPGEGLRAENGS